MFSLFSKQEVEIIAVFDIGNGSLGGSLVQISHTDHPHIIYSHREPLAYAPHATSQHLLDNMLKLLKSIATNLQKQGLPILYKTHGHMTVRRAYCTFSSPWYVSQTKVIKIEREKPFAVSETVISSLIKKEEEQFEKDQKEGKYEEIFGKDIMVMEKKIIHTKLNGYEVEDLIGKRAQQLEVTYFMSFISKEIIRNVEQTLLHVFHFLTISYSSYVLASWSAVRDIVPDANDFLFVDITGEVTDVSITSRGVLSQSVTFPLGRSSLIRAIVKKLDVPPEVALSFVAMKSKGTIEDKFDQQITAVADDVLKEWQENWFDALKTLHTYNTLPKKVFVTVDDDVADYFTRVISQALPKELFHSGSKFDVTVLHGEAMRPYVVVEPGQIADPFITIDSMFINKLVN